MQWKKWVSRQYQLAIISADDRYGRGVVKAFEKIFPKIPIIVAADQTNGHSHRKISRLTMPDDIEHIVNEELKKDHAQCT